MLTSREHECHSSDDLFGSDLDEDNLESHFPEIPGLIFLPGQLGEAECAEILSHTEDIGWTLNEDRNQAMLFGPLPKCLNRFEKLAKEIFPEEIHKRTPIFDQVIANYYAPGDGLKPHIDLPHRFDDGIIVTSLKGTCIFELSKDQVIHRIFLSPGDVIGLYAEARWDWKHGIPFNHDDLWKGSLIKRTPRVSITLRKMLPSKTE